jgi:phage gpG-like protein
MAASTANITKAIEKVQRLTQPQFLAKVAKQLQAEALKLVADGFKSETDPNGQAWAPIKRAGKILQDTGRLRASWAPVADGPEGFRIASNVEYAAAHQDGAHYPARSSAKPRTIWSHPETGKFVSKATKLKTVVEHTVRQTFGAHALVPRKMVPDDSKALPKKWADAFEKIVDRLITKELKIDGLRQHQAPRRRR